VQLLGAVEKRAEEVEGHLAPRQLIKNWDRLGLNLQGAEQRKENLENYHQHSHAASRTFFVIR